MQIMGGNPVAAYSTRLCVCVCICVCVCVCHYRELLKTNLFLNPVIVQVSCLDQSNKLINWAFILN